MYLCNESLSDAVRRIALYLTPLQILNFSSTCKYMNNIVWENDQQFWKMKVLCNYPTFLTYLPTEYHDPQSQQQQWKNIYKMLYINNVYAMGLEEYGRLGNNSNSDTLKTNLIKLSCFDNMVITQVSCGTDHTGVIANNQLYMFGSNTDGKLGLFDTLEHRCVSVPTHVEFFKDMIVTQVKCCHNYTIVVANDTLYTFGAKGNRLGQGQNRNYLLPKVTTPILQNITCIAGHTDHTAVISNKKLYMFGSGHYQLRPETAQPMVIKYFEDNNLNITHVACGYEYTCVIADGVLYTFGNNDKGQLGYETQRYMVIREPKQVTYFTENNLIVTHVACASTYTVVIANNKLFYFGLLKLNHIPIINEIENVVHINDVGELLLIGNIQQNMNINAPQNVNIPTLIQDFQLQNITHFTCSESCIFIIADGKLYSYGSPFEVFNDPFDKEFDIRRNLVLDNVSKLKIIKQISCSRNHLVLIGN